MHDGEETLPPLFFLKGLSALSEEIHRQSISDSPPRAKKLRRIPPLGQNEGKKRYAFIAGRKNMTLIFKSIKRGKTLSI